MIFLAPLTWRREGRAFLLAAAACLGGLFAVPGLVLGPAGTLGFYEDLLEAYGEMDWVAANRSSQFFAHVSLRYAGAAGFRGPDSVTLFRWVSYAIAALNLGLAFLLHRARLPHARLLSNLLLLLAVPFVLPTSWPSDLSFLPFAQGLLAWWILTPNVPLAPEAETEARGIPPSGAQRLRRAASRVLLGSSIVVSNALCFDLIGQPRLYGSAGFVFWAVLLLMLAAHLNLIPAVRGQRRRAARRAGP